MALDSGDLTHPTNVQSQATYKKVSKAGGWWAVLVMVCGASSAIWICQTWLRYIKFDVNFVRFDLRYQIDCKENARRT